MKSKKLLVVALLISGASLFAGEPVFIENRGDNEFLKARTHQLNFRNNAEPRDPFKFTKSRFSASGMDDGEKDMTSSGLFLNFGVFLPFSTYVDGFGIGVNLELGNFFRFAHPGQVGIGLRATWFSFDLGFYSNSRYYGSYYNSYGEIMFAANFVKVGPQGTFALNDKMAVDVFYQLGPNITLLFEDEEIFYGIGHEFGGNFRIKVFSVGLSARYANLWNTDPDIYNSYYYDGYSMVSLKLNVGFKF